MNEHGYCPHCDFDLDGGLIFETFMEKYNDRDKALEVAEMYGATETKGKWSKAYGLYSMEKDRTVQYQCPECNKLWDR